MAKKKPALGYGLAVHEETGELVAVEIKAAGDAGLTFPTLPQAEAAIGALQSIRSQHDPIIEAARETLARAEHARRHAIESALTTLQVSGLHHGEVTPP